MNNNPPPVSGDYHRSDDTEDPTPQETGLNSNQSSFQTRHRRHSDPKAPDLLGNLPLHQAFARNPDTAKIKELLREYSHGASIPNQFGRLPLHYAVDRSKVNVDAIKLLLSAYPAGANTPAADGVTPYDIALSWGLSREVLRMLLEAAPEQDPAALRMLKFGVLASVYFWIMKPRHAPIGVQRMGESFHSNEVHELGVQLRQHQQSALEAVQESQEHEEKEEGKDYEEGVDRDPADGEEDRLSATGVLVDEHVVSSRNQSRTDTPSAGGSASK